MVKKLQRRPNRQNLMHRIDKTPIETGISLKEILTMLAGSTGVIAALIWLGGRFFASGYFQSLNIPLYMLNFSIGEYGEQYFGVIILFLGVASSFLILNFWYILIVIMISIIAASVIVFFIRRHANQIKPLFDSLPSNRSMEKAITLALIAALTLSSFIFASEVGAWIGLNYVVTSSQAVTFFSKEPIDAIASLKAPSNDPLKYKYSNLRLLTYNSGKYYLYSDLDKTTCKPKEVYIVNESQIISVILSPGIPFDAPICVKPLLSSILK